MKFQIGHPVAKLSGYKWPGVIVAAFRTLAGEERYVVECTVPGVEGALHIYNAGQLVTAPQNAVTLEEPK